MTIAQLRRFVAKIRIDADGCWRWTGARTGGSGGQPYAYLRMNKKNHYGHRLAYQTFIGPIPAGLEIDHLCRKRDCVNPLHLEAVTRRENLIRGETFTARQVALTHCPKNHPYSGDNLYIDPRGDRQCKECRREAYRRWYRKQAA
jgi:hypothetical protein